MSTFAILIIYVMQFSYLNMSINIKFIEWIGVRKEDVAKNVLYD
jgi:hypothetical protein